MAVPTTMADLSTTASSNSPAGSDTINTSTFADDYLRAVQSIIRFEAAKGADIASATTTDLSTATGQWVDVTGTATITGLGTLAAGLVRWVRFTGASVLTHNATSLILIGGANRTNANGNISCFRSLGSGNWVELVCSKADGTPAGTITTLGTIATGVWNGTGIGVAYGGTGAATLTANNVILGNGTSAVQFVAPGTSGNVLKSNGTTWTSSTVPAITLGTPTATTSGTTVDYTSIPSGVKKIIVSFSQVSTNGTGDYLIQIGSGSIATTGYVSTAHTNGTSLSTNTSGFLLDSTNAAATTVSGSVVLTLLDSTNYIWCANGQLARSDGNFNGGAGTKTLSGELDRLRITTTSGDTFDNGTINIMYES